MLPHTRDFTRDGCTVGARLVTYEQLENDYVCNDCGGRVVLRAMWDEAHEQSIYWAECAACKGRDFISLRQYERQVADFPLIVRKLPPELKALLVRDEPPVPVEQAIAELYAL